MRVTNHWGMCAVIAVLLAASGCTNNGLDDSGGPNVVLEITQFNSPPIVGQTETGVCSNNDPEVEASGNECLSNDNCPEGEFCDLPLAGQGCQPTQWNVTLANVPKTPLATTSPYNDIVINQIILDYTWSNGFPSSTAITPFGLTVPADGSANLQFLPISQDLLTDLEEYLQVGGSASAALTFTFSGYVADSDAISVSGGAALELQNCLRAVEP